MNKMTRYFLLLFTLSLVYSFGFSQGKNIGVGNPTPHPSAIIHIESSNPSSQKGVTIPYTDTNAVNAYANSFNPPIPIANGLLIFQKGAETYYYYNAKLNRWIPLSGITGARGAKGLTGPTGAVGPTGYGSRFRAGKGFPSKIKGDTCGSYYLDYNSSNVFRFTCPSGPWVYIGGPYKSKILGGETVHLSSQTTEFRNMGSQNTTNMAPINNLNYTVTPPPGYTAKIWVHAYGAAYKTTVNNDYNYAKFDIYQGTPGIASLNWQTISMQPTGPAPQFKQDLVKWSISAAFESAGSRKIEVFGGQQTKNNTTLGGIIIAEGPGSPAQAHLEIMVIYIRD